MNKFKRFSIPASYLIVIAAILWAVDGIWRRHLFTLDPGIIVFYEHFLGALVILPFTLPWILNKKDQLNRNEWIALIAVSILSSLFGTLMFTKALQMINFIPFSVVMLLQKLQPLFAIAAASIILKERLTRSYLIWAGVALVAAYFVTFPECLTALSAGHPQFPACFVALGENHQTLYAALLAIGAAAAWGTGTALSRYSLIRHNPVHITGLRFWLVSGMTLIYLLIFQKAGQLGAPDMTQIGYLLTITFTTGLVALLLYYHGLKHVQAKYSTILELAFPGTAIFIDIFLYHTVLHWTQYAAAGILICAIIMISRLSQDKAQNKLEEY